jgi:hypothetical protein
MKFDGLFSSCNINPTDISKGQEIVGNLMSLTQNSNPDASHNENVKHLNDTLFTESAKKNIDDLTTLLTKYNDTDTKCVGEKLDLYAPLCDSIKEDNGKILDTLTLVDNILDKYGPNSIKILEHYLNVFKNLECKDQNTSLIANKIQSILKRIGQLLYGENVNHQQLQNKNNKCQVKIANAIDKCKTDHENKIKKSSSGFTLPVILIVVVIILIAIWYFFIRKKSESSRV